MNELVHLGVFGCVYGARASPTNPQYNPSFHKTELLGEIDQFSYSNSVPIPPPIFGGHKKNIHLPSNKGALATSPNPLFFWRKHTHW
jgi:hypothetical protein